MIKSHLLDLLKQKFSPNKYGISDANTVLFAWGWEELSLKLDGREVSTLQPHYLGSHGACGESGRYHYSA